ncbi:hypothetical protein tpqmel_0733 [Candidatus Gastranaerophilus sp. (ex Termes propinquus)]|nr:hypothetical protein tpqmel_0733 [Candidatus Gastranaerophilus sp. (ex Termes propinquus)]
MKAFAKTLIVCTVVCTATLTYTFLKNASWEPDMVPNNTPVSENKEGKLPEVVANERVVKICLLTNDDTPKFVARKTTGPKAGENGLEDTILLLLRGPTEDEKKTGLYSEIPQGTRLLGIKEEGGSLIINLSENFALGGGATSIMSRIKQLVKTVKLQHTEKPVYLYLDGKKVEYIGGEGVYLEQPLN